MAASISIQLDQLTPHQWQQQLITVDYSAYQQHWAYGEALSDFGATVWRAAIYDDNRLIGLAQIQSRKVWRLFHLVLCMRGPVWFSKPTDEVKADAYQALQAALPVPKPRAIVWMPESDDDAALRLARKRKIMTGYHTVMIDLTQSEDALLVAMDGKWRNRMKAAESENLSVQKLSNQIEQYAFLLQKETEQSQRFGYSGLNPLLVPAYQQHAGKDKPLILVAKHDGETVAAVLCLLHGHCATYHIGWSNEEGKARNAHNLLMWEAMKRLKQAGIRHFDLGGVNTDEGAGIARFKIGTGGKVISLSGSYL